MMNSYEQTTGSLFVMSAFDNNVDFQVDLAGSENVGRSGAVDKRLREAGKG